MMNRMKKKGVSGDWVEVGKERKKGMVWGWCCRVDGAKRGDRGWGRDLGWRRMGMVCGRVDGGRRKN
ncbi:hypothetical protein, partial [Paenibacillus sp. Y412MC10]|uniref:hypothetical protein n=1 Tax=Geobacillus sp. (strain Y412MC10) TaxID=481743 RepID=UPI0021B26450